MKIVSPVRTTEQLMRYSSSGADEFFGAPIMPQWNQKYGRFIEYNRRGNYGALANFGDLEEFLAVVAKAEEMGKPVSLTANALRVDISQCEILSQTFALFKQAGGRRAIVTDPNAVRVALNEGLNVTISSCADVRSAECARFYQNLGADRIILPRAVSLSEINGIISRTPGVLFEVFLMNSACRFDDGVCLGLHSTSCGSLCAFLDFRDGHSSTSGRYGSFAVSQNNYFYKQLLLDACGLCAIFDLNNIGVDSLKIVGRTLSTKKIEAQIATVKAALSVAESAKNRADYISGIELFRDHRRCRNGHNCYYPEIWSPLHWDS